jgi:hypothetical protein
MIDIKVTVKRHVVWGCGWSKIGYHESPVAEFYIHGYESSRHEIFYRLIKCVISSKEMYFEISYLFVVTFTV